MTTREIRPTVLIILDGWGVASDSEGNAITRAFTPYYDEICRRYPRTLLNAAGVHVGLAEGVAGNAELGHMNLGAGRVVKTVFSRIQDAVADGGFFDNSVIRAAIGSAVSRGSKIHLVGLLSDADVHSSMENLYALLRMAKRDGASEAYVHAILDGRDVLPRTADVYTEALEIKIADIGIGKIASLCGRFYAMDSSENWERTARAFTMMVHAEGERASDPVTAVRSSFLRGISDEFISPIVIESSPGVPVATVADGDLVIFFNHRADTMRQLARSIAVPDQGLVTPSAKPRVEAVCLSEYDRAFNLPVAFPPRHERGGLADAFDANSVINFRISETDRFPHVSSFLNCGLEAMSPFEQHIEIPAGDTSNRETEPEMRSFKVTDRLIRKIESDPSAVFIVNYPVPGLIAETGNLDRTIEAAQYIDTCLGGVLEKIREVNGIAVITASHGNAESMLSSNGEPDRLATPNPVPFHIIDESSAGVGLRTGGSLQDVAPTLLGILGIQAPEEMTGRDLRR